MNLAIVVPVYNEASCLPLFVDEWLPIVREHAPARLILVDDGSRDDSPAILDRLAERLPELMVIHQANAGHGAAIRCGYQWALDLGAEWIFQTDSDRQFDPSDFAALWSRRPAACFLLGTRTDRDDPAARKWLSRANRLLLALLFGVRLRDPNTPFRLMDAGFLRPALQRIPPAVFAPNVLITIEAARSGRGWLEIPVSHRRRETGVVSIQGWKTVRLAFRCLREWALYRLKASV